MKCPKCGSENMEKDDYEGMWFCAEDECSGSVDIEIYWTERADRYRMAWEECNRLIDDWITELPSSLTKEWDEIAKKHGIGEE